MFFFRVIKLFHCTDERKVFEQVAMGSGDSFNGKDQTGSASAKDQTGGANTKQSGSASVNQTGSASANQTQGGGSANATQGSNSAQQNAPSIYFLFVPA